MGPVDSEQNNELQPEATCAFLASDAQAKRLAEVLDRYMEQLTSGTAPPRTQLLAEHPELAVELENCLAGIEFIHSLGGRQDGAPKQLSDFRIIREVGRGGMGAVYEAEQVSLGRRVALKILRFGGVSDPEALQRFQREAETVARLHHTNIVPIFAVGSERGVSYYAMQFIEGRSLDQVLRQADKPLDPDEVTQWGLQAAEALVHAHARGVIHRDVKPSNLLLDEEGRIWLTDFGLAKRLDDATLSMTGALLGTPRYMSPEQAAAAHHRLDHRTDIYSLGATLYELVTGRPVFAGETPHQVITQILTAEPLPPRRHRPELPRDLETILMKCLAKDAGERYTSARQLADDLRALLEGRPISARRTAISERVTKWVKRQRRSVALTATAVAATLALVVLGATSHYFWQRTRLAFLMLKTDRPPLVAELLDNGRPATATLTVPTQHRVEIPAGDYQLQLAGEGRLSQTFDLRLTRGEVTERKLDLDDQLLWGDLELERSYRLATIERSAAGDEPPAACVDVVRLTEEGIECIDGGGGWRRWGLDLAEPTHAMLQDEVDLQWRTIGASYHTGLGIFDERPHLVSAAEATSASFDLNGDGTSDLVLAARHQPWMIAVSGAGGRPLWVVARGSAAEPNPPERPLPNRFGSIPYPPLVVDDQDGDGIADLVTLFVDVHEGSGMSERWLELISGANGQSLRRYDLADSWFTLPAGAAAPAELSWFFGHGGGYSSHGSAANWFGDYVSRQRNRMERSGPYVYLPTQPQWSVGPEAGESAAAPPAILFIAGTHLVHLDPATGQPPAPPQETGVRAALEPRYGDLDGDGHVDLLLVEPLPDKMAALPGQMPRTESQIRLTAWSPQQQSRLWQRELSAALPCRQYLHLPAASWPLLVDLDGDGVGEVLVPSGNSWHGSFADSPSWGELTVLDGRTGETRWQRQLFHIDQQLDHFIAGPDIDGDGVREVYVAALWGKDSELYVDCLSGADGRTLWRGRQRLMNQENEAGELHLAQLSWYDRGHDGWPQLIVPLRAVSRDLLDRVCMLSAGTGQVTHIARGASEVEVGDLDGDGVQDLLLFCRAPEGNWSRGGTLQGVRGVGCEPWRRAASGQVVVGDLDGDGVRDFVEPGWKGELSAHSGADGRLLWRTRMKLGEVTQFEVRAAAQHDAAHGLLPTVHDLDGDGVPDLLLVQSDHSWASRPILSALSGRTGRRLWVSEMIAQRTRAPALLDVRDLDGDGLPEIIIALAMDYGQPVPQPQINSDTQLWLAVLSGRDGRTRWIEPLTEDRTAAGGGPRYHLDRVWLEAAYADLDGDQVLDIVLPAQNLAGSRRLEMRAVSGNDGRSLWHRPLPASRNEAYALSNIPPAAAADFDGDGRQEVVVVSIGEDAMAGGTGPSDVARVELLDGATGALRRQWQTPVVHWRNEVRGEWERVGNRVRPRLVRRPDGKHWVALMSWNEGHQVHVLDDNGQLVSELQLAETFHYDGSQLWVIDADGDGHDELAILSERAMVLVRPDKLDEPLWQRTTRQLPLGRVLGVLPDRSAPGRIVVRGDGADRSLRGIDPVSGRVVWTCAGPRGEWVNVGQQGATLLSSAQPERPAQVLYHSALVARGRRAVWTDRSATPDVGVPSAASSEAEAIEDRWAAVARAEPVLQPASVDPRLQRPLPWRPLDHDVEGLGRLVAWAAFFGITLAALPLATVAWLIRRRQWGLKTMLLLPLVAGVMMLSLLSDAADKTFSPTHKLLAAYLGAGPVLFALAVLALWSWRGRRRLVAAWLALGAVGTAVMMVVSLAMVPMSGAPLQPGEYYTWSGWYWMAPPVFYVVAWVLFVSLILQWLLKAAWRWIQARRSRTFAPA